MWTLTWLSPREDTVTGACPQTGHETLTMGVTADRGVGWSDLNSAVQEMAPTPVLLPGESHGGRSLVGYRPWGRKESDTAE